MLDIKRVIASAPKKNKHQVLRPLFTKWGKEIMTGGAGDDGETDAEEYVIHLNSAISEHPHPQCARVSYQRLDGWWDYCIKAVTDAASEWKTATKPVEYEGRIRVPFSPEALLSGVNRQLQPNELLWYRCFFSLASESKKTFERQKNRLILHFEAVDYACACYCNDVCVGTHIGGYLPFSFDITDALTEDSNELILCVYDPSDNGVQLRGKQKLERGGIWYTAQSGIWQSVWLERVPENHIASFTIDAQADTGILTLDVAVNTTEPAKTLSVCLLDGKKEVGRASTDPHSYRVNLKVSEPKLWSPENPHLYHLELSYGSDVVSSYCAFRSITIEEDEQGTKRLCLNHQPYFLRGVLDQGYWPDGLLTPPSDEALAFDIQSMLDLGFNMLRKHIKVESDRWYYHCDRLGMLVWQDMVSGGSALSSWYSSYKPTFFRRSWGNFSDTTTAHYRSLSAEDEGFQAEWIESCKATVNYLKGHPSIITWVLFNEGWGQFEAARATEMVRRLDPTRAIDAVSGWYDQSCGDFLSIHNYFRPLEVYPDKATPKRAFVISEFGGLSYHTPQHSSLETSYGYESFSSPTSLKQAIHHVLCQADALEKEGLAGYVYTQLSDVEEETNGLLSYDRHINKLAEQE